MLKHHCASMSELLIWLCLALKNINENFVYARLKIKLVFVFSNISLRPPGKNNIGKEIIIIVLTHAHILTMVAMLKILSVILIRWKNG